MTKDRQDLYLHPTSFSGVMDEANIQPLQEQLSKGKPFRCYAVDCYAKYADLSDEEYRAAPEAKREEITALILEQRRTKRTNLYITDPVAPNFAKHFEIRRLCDRDRRNAVGNRFISELIDQLLQERRLVSAEMTHGAGIRTATAWMREFSRAYESVPEMLAQAMTVGWTQNTVILEAGRTLQERTWYIRATRQFGWTKLELQRKIAAKIHLEIFLDFVDEICYTEENAASMRHAEDDKNLIRLPWKYMSKSNSRFCNEGPGETSGAGGPISNHLRRLAGCAGGLYGAVQKCLS